MREKSFLVRPGLNSVTNSDLGYYRDTDTDSDLVL